MGLDRQVKVGEKQCQVPLRCMQEVGLLDGQVKEGELLKTRTNEVRARGEVEIDTQMNKCW